MVLGCGGPTGTLLGSPTVDHDRSVPGAVRRIPRERTRRVVDPRGGEGDMLEDCFSPMRVDVTRCPLGASCPGAAR